MSLSREVSKEICDYIKEHCAAIFGQKFWECRIVRVIQVQIKAEKFETKFLVLSKFRVFILHGKYAGNLKIEKCFNILALRQLNVNVGQESTPGLNIGWELNGRPSNLFIKTEDEKISMELAAELLTAIKHYFPDIRESLTNLMQISPPSLLNSFNSLPSSTPDLPCNNFRRSYVAFCDNYDQPYKDEVVWDIERIYFPNDLRTLKLEDFSHLVVKDHLAILGCIQFSSYFTGLHVDGTKLTSEHIDVILNILRRSHSLKKISLLNCALPKEFIAQLANALQTNTKLPLESLELSGNNFDDKKGIVQLSTTLPKIHTFKKLVLNDCCLSEKSIHHLAYGLYTGLGMDNTIQKKFELHTLILNKNYLKDDVNELINFISLCNTLRVLDLSNSNFHVDRLWSALKLGGLKLESLRLAGAQTNKKLSSRDNTSVVVRELFSSMVNLKELDLAGTLIAPEILQNILSGIANNNCLTNINLNLDGVCTDKSAFAILEQHLPNCPISRLSLRDNNFEQDSLKIFPAIGQIRSLVSLDIGGANFHNLRSNKKFATVFGKVLGAIVKLICKDEAILEELILSDCRFGTYISVILNALGMATIKVLDISNNEIKDFGARLLSKALQLNNTIIKIVFDKNLITFDGFAELANGLKLNRTLIQIPSPISDIWDCLNGKSQQERVRLSAIILDIENCLERNRKFMNIRELECQKVIHLLNNRGDKYDVDNSSQKKIIFHNLTKSLAELAQNSPNLDSNISQGILVDQIVSNIVKCSREKVESYSQNFKEILLSKGVEICGEDKTFDYSISGEIAQQLKNQVNTLVENALTQITWNSLLNQSDSLLSSSKGLKLCETQFANFNNIETSVHARSNGAMIHRPHSVLDDSLILSSLASNSMDNELDSLIESESPSANNFGNSLVHLAKNRPKPARLMRNITKMANSPTGSGLSIERMAVLAQQQPLMNKHNNSFDSMESDRKSASPALNEGAGTTSLGGPPPLIPRRNKKSVEGSNQPPPPPKLPPKPEESPKLKSLRNHKTLVLPTNATTTTTQNSDANDLTLNPRNVY